MTVHHCGCTGCRPELDPRYFYESDVPDHEYHLGIRFHDHVPTRDITFTLDGRPVKNVYEADAGKGLLWVHSEPMHRCRTCDHLAVCAQLLSGKVTILARITL